MRTRTRHTKTQAHRHTLSHVTQAAAPAMALLLVGGDDAEEKCIATGHKDGATALRWLKAAQ